MKNTLQAAHTRIRRALESGIRMTTAQGNRIGRTVDFRKVVSRLRRNGFDVRSYWNERNGRRWKTYYYVHPLPGRGTRMEEFGHPELDFGGERPAGIQSGILSGIQSGIPAADGPQEQGRCSA